MKIHTALGILLMASLSMCSTGSAILEANSIQHFEVHETHESAGSTIHISGLCGHSSYVVKNIETKRRGDVLYLNIHLALATDALLQKGFTGNFSCAVPVPQGVEKVLLGQNHIQIWAQPGNGERPASRLP